ncbi:glycosyl transferase [Tanacetum coccineum]
MRYQEPVSRTTSSTTAKNDNRMSCQEPKPRTTSSTTAKNDMSCQERKSRTTSSKTTTTSLESVLTILTILKLFIAIISFIGVGLYSSIIAEPPHPQDPKPTQWPHQFHSLIVMNNSGIIELVDLWYDWTNGRSFNIIQHQRGSVLYDLEWNNGTSFHYTVGSHGTCSSAHMEVTIVWENAGFITYYEDVVTKRPVHWAFYTGREAHVMTLEVGAALEDAKWQVPSYCFEQTNATEVAPMDVGAITHRADHMEGSRRCLGSLDLSDKEESVCDKARMCCDKV